MWEREENHWSVAFKNKSIGSCAKKWKDCF